MERATFGGTRYRGRNADAACFDGTATRGPFSCMRDPHGIEEGEPAPIVLERRAYAAEIPVEETKTMTVVG